MSVFLSPNLPANVVEIGNEISQAKINEINAGTLATQTWVTTGFAPKASPTFTGTVTIPAGASISGYATQSYVTGLGYITDAPSNGSQYARQNGAWAVVTGGGGGGGIAEAPNDGYSYVRRMSGWVSVGSGTYETVTTQEWVNSQGFVTSSYVTGLGYQTASDVSTYVTGLGYITSSGLSVTNINLTGDFNGYSMGSGYYSFKYDSTANTLRMQDGVGSGITISATAITFPDSTTISTAPIVGGKSVNSQSGSYTLASTDANNIVHVYVMGGMGGFSITVPQDSTYSFAIGTVIIITSDNNSYNIIPETTGGGGGVPSINNGSYATPIGWGQTLVKVAADTWISY